MKKPPINFTVSKDELARRRMDAKGRSHIARKDQIDRWSEGYRELERWGRECGVRVTMDDMRRALGSKLWR